MLYEDKMVSQTGSNDKCLKTKKGLSLYNFRYIKKKENISVHSKVGSFRFSCIL